MQKIYDLFSPVFLTIWPLQFHWYGLFYAISFYFWYVFILKNLRFLPSLEWKVCISEQEFDKMFFWISIFALIWWRLWHVLFYDFWYYSNHLLEIFQVWKWWMASHWWIIWAMIWYYFFVVKSKQDSPGTQHNKTVPGLNLKFLDLFAISWAFWFWLWRLWNFINWELFWKIFIKFNEWNFFSFLNFFWVNFWDWIVRHPVQIYSSLANFLIFWILFFLLQKKFFNQEENFWKIFYLFLILFWIQRFFLEFLKENFHWNNYFEILTTGQIFSIFMILIWIFLFWNKKNFCNK